MLTETRDGISFAVSSGLELLLLEPEQKPDEGQVYHLIPAGSDWNKIEREHQHRKRNQKIEANALIIKRTISPFIIKSIISDSLCIIFSSDNWIGYFNIRVNDLIEIPELINRYFEEWPDRKMGSTDIWVGPLPYRSVKKSSKRIDEAVRSSITNLYSSRAILRIDFTALNDKVERPSKYIAALCVRS